ncbi:MAG: protease complex subunit PrcB family protein [Bacillota bacterium]
MIKKTLSLVIAFALVLVSGSVALGDIEEKLQGHWSENSIDKSFATFYFPYLARDSFAGFNPDAGISRENFTLSLASLLKTQGYMVSGLASPGTLTRAGMAKSVGEKLLEIGLAPADEHSLPFGDISTMDNEALAGLRLLHREGIVRGESSSVFNPARRLTQAEAIIVLQRIQSAVKNFSEIDYRTLGVTQSYNNHEEIITKVSDDVVTLVVTREFPTPGYSISVKSIERENESFRVYFKITPPEPGTMVPQVITYKTITIELDREDLGEPPYDFVVDGFRDM